MIRAVILFVQITLLVFAAVWLAGEPGEVTIVWRDWRLNAPIGMLVLAFGLVSLGAAVGYRAWRFVRRSPGQIVASHRSSRERRGYRALAEGMLAVAGGDGAGALRHGRRAESLMATPDAPRLLLAQAAELENDEASARNRFESLLEVPDSAFVGRLGLMRLAMAAGDTALALEHANDARALRPGANWLLPELFKLETARGDWASADRTMAEALKRRVVEGEPGRRRRAAVLLARGLSAAADRAAAIGFMREANDLDPALVPAATAYADLLKDEGKTRRAARILEQAWSRDPHPDIAFRYADIIGGTDPIERVKTLQRLMAFNSDQTEARPVLAEASLDARLWGEARKYLELAMETGTTRRICELMARLEESQENGEDAAQAWIARSAAAAPDPTWICESCGEEAPEWRPLCESCGTFNSLNWRSVSTARPPDRLAGLAPNPDRPALPPVG